MIETHPGMVLAVKCRVCKETSNVIVIQSEFQAWTGGKLIQDAMPSLSSDDREMLISQTCPRCWDQIFPEESECESDEHPGDGRPD